MKENAGKTRYVLLGLLAHCPQTGYAIKKAIEYEYSHFWQEGFGQIYPALKVLVAEGLAESAPAQSGANRGQIVYTITEKGRAELRDWLEKAPEIEKLRYELLLKISFGANTQTQVLLGHLDAFIARNEAYLAELSAFDEIFAQLKKQGQDHTFNALTALCGKYVYAAMRDWALEAKTILTERETHLHETKNS